MVAVAGTRDSLERVVGQRKVCHCSRGCESHYCAARVRDGAPDACHEVPRGMQFVDPKRPKGLHRWLSWLGCCLLASVVNIQPLGSLSQAARVSEG